MIMLTPNQCVALGKVADEIEDNMELVLVTQVSEAAPLNRPQDIHATWTGNTWVIDPEGNHRKKESS